jgi:hypothetical protein
MAWERWSQDGVRKTQENTVIYVISAALHGGGKVADFPISLSHIQYDLHSRFTRPQELARNTMRLDEGQRRNCRLFKKAFAVGALSSEVNYADSCFLWVGHASCDICQAGPTHSIS